MLNSSLVRRRLSPLIIRLLLRMYTNQNMRVKWGPVMTSLVSVTNGVKQGGVLSPILFIVYFDELLYRLSRSSCGCHIGKTFAGALGYADDIVLLSPTYSGLDTMLDICKSFAAEYDVMFNPAKTKLLVFERNVDQAHVNFMEEDITCCPIEKHLGNVIGYDCEKHKIDSNTLQFITQVNRVHSHFRNVTLDVKYKLFKSLCMPLYGCQLWDWSNRYTQHFEVTWRKCIRKLMDIPRQTHCRLLHLICDDIVVREQLFSRLLSFVRGLHTSDNSLVKLCYNMMVQGSLSAISNSMSVVSQHLKVNRASLHTSSVCRAITETEDIELDRIQASVIRDLLFMRHELYYGRNCIFNHDEVNFMMDVLCTS